MKSCSAFDMSFLLPSRETLIEHLTTEKIETQCWNAFNGFQWMGTIGLIKSWIFCQIEKCASFTFGKGTEERELWCVIHNDLDIYAELRSCEKDIIPRTDRLRHWLKDEWCYETYIGTRGCRVDEVFSLKLLHLKLSRINLFNFTLILRSCWQSQ